MKTVIFNPKKTYTDKGDSYVEFEVPKDFKSHIKPALLSMVKKPEKYPGGISITELDATTIKYTCNIHLAVNKADSSGSVSLIHNETLVFKIFLDHYKSLNHVKQVIGTILFNVTEEIRYRIEQLNKKESAQKEFENEASSWIMTIGDDPPKF